MIYWINKILNKEKEKKIVELSLKKKDDTSTIIFIKGKTIIREKREQKGVEVDST